MARTQILTVIMAVIFAAVVFAVFEALSSPPPAQSAVPDANQPVELDVSKVRDLVTQQVKEQMENIAPPPAPEQTAPAPTPHIEQVAIDGQDISDLLNLEMWKFKFHVPKGQYTNYVWMERWTRGASEPTVTVLSQTPGVWEDGRIVVKLPAKAAPGLFVRVNDLSTRNTKLDDLDIPSPTLVDPLKQQSIDPGAGNDIYLVTLTHDNDAVSSGDDDDAAPSRADAHLHHDVTIYIKTRFAPGAFAPFKLHPAAAATSGGAASGSGAGAGASPSPAPSSNP